MAIDAGYTITPLSGKDGTNGQNGASLSVQYSVNGTSNWHDTFASGDIYMRQKLGNGSWSSAMKIVGEDGKNAITMTSATTPSGEYNGQIGFWQGQPYMWNGSTWVKQIGDLPTDAVLHYSFDDIPDYPDGTAVERNLNGDTYNVVVRSVGTITTDAYTEDGQIHKSNVNGNANYKTNVGSNRSLGIYFGITSGTGLIKIIEFVAKTPNLDVHIFYRQTESDSRTTIYPLGNSISVGKHKLEVFVPQNCFEYSIVFYSYASDLNYTEWELTGYYLGDGSYSTPIIDNANGQNNAINNGGIAVKGVSGKGIQFLQSSNAYISSNNKPLGDSDSWTLSFWLNLNKGVEATSKNPRLYQFGYLDYCFCDNFYIGGSGGRFNFATYKDNSHRIFASVNMSQYIGQTIFVTVETEIDTESTSTKRVYINGILKTQATGSIIEKPTYSSWSIGGNVGNQHLENTMIDDFQIFNRALSEKEVQALYQNKANTPKYYDLSDYSIEQIDDDNVVDHLTEKPQLLSKWLEIYNAKNVSSALPTSNVSASGEYKGVIDSSNEVGVIETDAVQAYITASNALRSALWGTNGYLVDMNRDSTLSGSLDSLFSTYRQTLQKARTVISEQQASSASALTIVNSNPFCLIPVNAGGTVTTYENTGLRLQVFNGVTQLTPKASSATLSEGQWKVTANGSNITAGSQTVGNGYIDFGNVSALNADTAVITFTITALVNGVTNTLYTTQKFSKSKEGADGRIYTLLPDYTAIKKSADGSVLAPSSVTVQAKSWTGSLSPALYSSGDLKAFENDVQIGSTVSQGNTITVSPTGSYPVVIKLFVHGTNTLLDTLTIPVLQEVKGDTGRGLVSSVEKYKLSANLTEPFNESTASSWTDTASSVPTAQLPYLHHAVLQTYSEAPLNEYGDDVIIREYVTNGANGTSTRYSTASVTSSTESIALSTITGGTAVVGDVVIAGSMIFSVTAVGSTNATVQYKASIKGEDNKSITVIMSAPNVNVSCDSSGTPTGYTNTPTTIRVYQNAQELSYDGSGTSNGKWKATILSRSGCTGGSFTDSGVYAALSAITGMSSDNASRNITITGKRTDGTSFTTTVTQTLSKNKQGLQGGTGSRAIRYLGKSATKPNSSSQTSGAPTGLDTPIQGDWYFCTTDGAVYYRSDSSTGTTYTWTVITWLDTTTVPDYRLTACLEDMLELSDQITTNQTMNNFIDKYTTVLIANEGFINKLRAKDINFKNSVSSYKDSGYVAGDLAISMGKNPKNNDETDNNFLIQSFVTALNKSSSDSTQIEQWKKDFYTQYNKDERTVDFFLNGLINAIYGIKTYQPIYAGSDILEQDYSATTIGAIYYNTEVSSYIFIRRKNGIYAFRCFIDSSNHSNDKLYISVAGAPQDGLSYYLSFSSKLQVSLQNANIQKAVCCNDKIYLQIDSPTTKLLEYNPDTNTTRSIITASGSGITESKVENLMLFEDNTLLYTDGNSRVKRITIGTSITDITSYSVYGTRMYKIGLHKYILFHNDYEMTMYNTELTDSKALGYKNFTNSLVYEDGVSVGSIYNLLGDDIFNIGATDDKIIISGKKTNSTSIDYYILCSSDFGNTFNISLKYTKQVQTPSGTLVPDFLFRNIYFDNGLILLNGDKSFIYSIDNGKTFMPYATSGLNGNYLGESFVIETPECKDIIIPIAVEYSAGSTNTRLDLLKIRSRNVSKPYRIRRGRPAEPLEGDFWIDQ